MLCECGASGSNLSDDRLQRRRVSYLDAAFRFTQDPVVDPLVDEGGDGGAMALRQVGQDSVGQRQRDDSAVFGAVLHAQAA